MAQKFHVNPQTKQSHENGAIAYGAGGPFDCLGNYTKIKYCPVIVGGVEMARLTCYATGYAVTMDNIPACTRYKGQHIGGYFARTDTGPEFRVYDRFADKINTLRGSGNV